MNADERTSGCPSDYALDAYLAAGMPAAHPVRRHLETCPSCRDRLQVHAQVGEMFERDVYPATVDAVVGRLVKRRAAWWQNQLPVLLAAAASLVLVLAVSLRVDQNGGREESYLGVKGTVGVQVIARRAGKTFRLGPGDTLLAGDMLRLVVAPPRAGYLMVVSIDVRGKLDVYWPHGGGAAMRVAPGEAPLPGSVVLDEQTGPERILVLWNERPFDEHAVRQAFGQAWGRAGHPASLERLPLDAEQTSFLFFKGTTVR